MNRTHRLRAGLVAVAALAATIALAACGGDDTVGGGNEGEVQTAEGGTPSGDITISNWPGYIDKGSGNTIDEFEEEYGVTVNYLEDVDYNTGFFGKLQPQLEQGDSGGRSIFVVTDWMANRMYELGSSRRSITPTCPPCSRTSPSSSRNRRTTRTASTRSRGRAA